MAWYNPTDPTQRNWMLAGLACLILVVPYRMYVLADREVANDDVRTRVESLASQNRAAGVLSARGGGDLEERMALYERHVDRLEQLIPSEESVPALVDDIMTRARSVEVEVVNLGPEPPEQTEFYTRRAYSLSVVGEYHSVGRFLTEVASLSRIVTPVQVDLQLYAQSQLYPEMESPVIATFRIETFVLPDPNRPPPAPAAGG